MQGREKAQALLCEHFGPFGPIKLPYVEMGKIDSLHLFGDTELIIMAMYWHNRKRWKRVLDIGANIGLHSVLMAKLGMHVRAFEPDPTHFARLQSTLAENDVWTQVKSFQTAVHTYSGEAKFVRVLNNLTGNHLVGYKESYGPREDIWVETVDVRTLWPMTDFAKIDSEGNEADLVRTLTENDVETMQLVLEVRNRTNAVEILSHCRKIGVPVWAQKVDWAQVTNVEHMPHQNREGSIFIGHRGPWE